MQGVGAVVLAAGQGKRMKSSLPKVLHCLAGLPLVGHVLATLSEAGVAEVVVVHGQEGERVRAVLGEKWKYACQPEPRGTGDAVRCALPVLSRDCREVLVLCGDTPLLTAQTIKNLVAARRAAGAAVALVTSWREEPLGYGRIVRDASGLVAAVVEESDATPEQKEIKEVNTGTYVFLREELERALGRLSPENAQGEYYLPDCISYLRQEGKKVVAVPAPASETAGVNTRQELAAAARLLRLRECQRLMESGVTIIDPETTYVDRGVEVGQDTVIYPFTFLEGRTRVGPGCVIGPGTRISSSVLGAGVEVQYAVIVEAVLGDGCEIGPFTYIRPGTVLEKGVKVGGFVELKKAVVGTGSKIPHLSYIGDAVIGAGVNVGAGTITCNYDGFQKHQTRIGDRAFIGSNTNLVAPVTVGEDAYIGAGSTITKDVPPGALALERAKQVVIPEWRKRKRHQEAP